MHSSGISGDRPHWTGLGSKGPSLWQGLVPAVIGPWSSVEIRDVGTCGDTEACSDRAAPEQLSDCSSQLGHPPGAPLLPPALQGPAGNLPTEA